jgi:hypothetical protein
MDVPRFHSARLQAVGELAKGARQGDAERRRPASQVERLAAPLPGQVVAVFSGQDQEELGVVKHRISLVCGVCGR